MRSTLVIGQGRLDPACPPRWPAGTRPGTVVERLRRARGPGAGSGAARCRRASRPAARIGARSRPCRLPVLDRSGRLEEVDPSRSPRRSTAARARPACSRTSSAMYSKNVMTNSGVPREALAELGVLGRDADRTGVEVADPHHDAARDDEGCGGEPELLGPEQRRDDHVAARLQLAVDLDDDPVAQPVHEQRLLGLGQAELPGDAGVLERGHRRRAGPAVVARDEHDVGMGLGHPGGDRAHARPRPPA